MVERRDPDAPDGAVVFSVDDLAAHALQSFPADGEDFEAARQYGMRLISREIARRRAAGETADGATDQALRRELDAALARLAPRLQRRRTGWSRFRFRRRPPPVAAGVDEAHIAWLVGRAFAAPTDGSRRHARVLAARARGDVKRALREARVGWLAAWRLRRHARALIRARMTEIIEDRE